MMMARGRPGRGAFSLIEILIVLVMISLLARIALPSWRTHQHQAVLREAKWVLLRLDIASLQTPWSSVIQLIVSVESSISRVDLPPMRSVRLLIPAY